MNFCNVPVSIGELYDKYSILLIKEQKIKENYKLNFIKKEISYLQPLINKYNLNQEVIEEIKNINEKLWDIEDAIRIKEKNQEFDDEFICLARSVYKMNDERYNIKCKINSIIHSEIREIKSYK